MPGETYSEGSFCDLAKQLGVLSRCALKELVLGFSPSVDRHKQGPHLAAGLAKVGEKDILLGTPERGSLEVEVAELKLVKFISKNQGAFPRERAAIATERRTP